MISGDRGGQTPGVNAGTPTAALRVLNLIAVLAACTKRRLQECFSDYIELCVTDL